jgi:hypothetical protein
MLGGSLNFKKSGNFILLTISKLKKNPQFQNFQKPSRTSSFHKIISNNLAVLQFGCGWLQMTQNPHQHINFFAILITYSYAMSLQWHINHENLCLLNNVDIEKL